MDCNYVLDLVLPAGPTGPRGEIGATGPTGPSALKSLVYMEYATTSDAGPLRANSYTLLPAGTKTFSVNNTTVNINEDGVYEFTICGMITGLSQNEDITLKVQIEGSDHPPIGVDVAHFTATVKDIFFSQTFVYQLKANQVVTVFFQKNSTSTSLAHMATLIIKQLGF